MASNASRGAAAKAKTKRWLEARGYTVGDLEIVRWVWKFGKPAFAIKKDQWASDLLAIGHNTVLFVQVKSGASASGGTFPAARREFATFTFPDCTRQIIVGWPPLARTPRVVEVFREGGYTEVVAV
jgi:hypothetical protein